jgi:flagella basal body P-ring formation protein FlgA
MREMEAFKRKDTRRVMLAVAMVAFISQAAWASSEISPKSNVILTSDVLTVGDVFDGVSAGADHVLSPAPALGKTMVLGTRDLTRISNAFNLGWEAPPTGMSVTVRRNANVIDRYQIEAALQEKLMNDLPGQKFEFELQDKNLSMNLPQDNISEPVIDYLKVDLSKGEFRAVAAAGDVKKDIGGKIHQLVEVPVLTKAMRSGDVISVNDIQYIDMRANAVSASTLVSTESLVGQTPRRGVPAMRPLAAGDLTAPVAVKKGEIVTMTLESGQMQLTAQGRALDNGAEGEVVRIMNTSSNQVIEGVVKGLRTVSVGAPTAALDDRS